MMLTILRSLLTLTTITVVLTHLVGCAASSTSKRDMSSPAISAELDQTLAQLSPKARLNELDLRSREATIPSKRAYYQLLAMELLMEYNKPAEVRKRLQDFKSRKLDNSYKYRVNLLLAQLALANDQAPLALQKLPKQDISYPIEAQISILHTRAIALAKLGYSEESLATRLELDKLLQLRTPPKLSAIERNHQVIWSTIQTAPEELLLAMEKEFPTLTGWMALAAIVTNSQISGASRDLAIANWQKKHRKHPAVATLASTLRSKSGLITRYPKTIALLLPLNGKFSNQAKAIRDGFMAGYFSHDISERPVIKIYDTNSSKQTIAELYNQAISEGANLVVGPLRKPRVAALIKQKKLKVPVLSLNYSADSSVSDRVIQFGLLFEDEARQAAELAIIKDQLRAIVYTPNSKFGERLSKAFTERFTELGGEVLIVEKYSDDPNNHDHSQPIKRSLNILQSNNRRSILSSVTGKRYEFEPRRRQDVDAIFLIAGHQHARNLRSQLKYHDAGDISIYATSKAYSGTLNPSDDILLNGLVFSDMPWILQGNRNKQFAQAKKHWPGVLNKYPRLYALGLDAYRIIPHLARLRSNPFDRFQGMTGNIALNNDNRIHRELVWATFVDGEPQLMEFETVEDHDLFDPVHELTYLRRE